MKKKFFALLIAGTLVTLGAHSQTIKENLDKLAKDKSTRDKADKADVLMRKRSISDSVPVGPAVTSSKVISKAPAVKKVKHKKHKRKLKLKKPSK